MKGFGWDIPKILTSVGIFGAMILLVPLLVWLSPRGVECRSPLLKKGVEVAVDNTIQRAGSDYVIVMTEQGRRLWEAEPSLEQAVLAVYAEAPSTLPGFAARPVFQKLLKSGHDPWEMAKKHQVDVRDILALVTARACEVYYQEGPPVPHK